MDKMFTLLAFLATIISLTNVVSGERKAVCKIVQGSGSGNVAGTIELSQPASGSNVTMKIQLQGFNVTGSRKHGYHVHENGSTDNHCMAAGAHLNILHTLHGAPTDDKQHRHTGDFGNIEMDSSGVVSVTISDWLISLYDEPTSVIGKPLVVHELEDDLGRGNASTSNTTGNAGARLGCCIIQLTDSSNLTGSSTSILPTWLWLMLALCVVIGQDAFRRVN